jgi:hypothetical protein
MEEWRKNGSTPWEKPKLGDFIPSDEIQNDEETAERALEQWKKAMEEWRNNGSPPGEKPKIGDYMQSKKIVNDEDVVKKALKQRKKDMEDWRKNGSPPDEKPKMGEDLPAKKEEDEATKVSEPVLRSVAEWRSSRGQLGQYLNEKRGYKFNCSGTIPWTKKGKLHCASPGQWPCYRSCVRDRMLNHDKVRSGECMRFCKITGNSQVSIKQTHTTSL